MQAQEEGQQLTGEEIGGLGSFLLVAGNETTTKLIGNTVLALLKNPGEIEKVRANPALLPNLVEEGLRYEAPAQMAPRFTTQEIALAGTPIPAGVPVVVLFGSANHDERNFVAPERFPERFDITRDTQGHLTFRLRHPFLCRLTAGTIRSQSRMRSVAAVVAISVMA